MEKLTKKATQFQDTKEKFESIKPLDSCNVSIICYDSSITIYQWQMDDKGWNILNPPLSGANCNDPEAANCIGWYITWVNTNEDHNLHIAYRKAGVTPPNVLKKAGCPFHSYPEGQNCIIPNGVLHG